MSIHAYGNSDIRPFSLTKGLSRQAPILRRLFGAITRVASPGFGWCSRCGRSWSVCQGHICAGAFPLCEACYGELTPEERLPHYRALFEDWQLADKLNGRTTNGYEDADWQRMKAAVLGERDDISMIKFIRAT